MIKQLIAVAAVAAVAVPAQAAVSLTSANTAYTQSFDTLASTTWVNDSTLVGWSLFRTTGTVLTPVVGTGSSNAGGFYNFGATAATDRALGSVASGSTGTNYIAASFTNSLGADITSFALAYTGEQWRAGSTTTNQSLVLQYGFGSAYNQVSFINAGTAFNFTAPVNTSAGAINGNTAGAVAGLGGTVATGWSSGQTLWLRWVDVDNTGADHGLAIDNFSLSVTAVPEPGTYAMLLAGLASLGFVARRRRA